MAEAGSGPTCGRAMLGSPGLVSSLGKLGASLMDLSVGPARPHLLWPCVPHLSSCRALEPSKMRTSSSLLGFSISPRPDTQEPALLLSFLHPHILSSPSQTSHFLSCLTAKFRLPSSLCFMPTKLLVGQPSVL